MNLIQKFNAVWQKVGVVQRALVVAIVLACVISGGLLTKWATTADMGLLYSGIGPEEAGEIVDKISELGIQYEVKNNGGSIYVPKEQIHQLRLTMARNGLPTGGKTGIKLLEDSKIGLPPIVQQVKVEEAFQQELAMTIQWIDSIDSARVHIARPEQSGILASDNDVTTATVMVKIKPGWSISQGNIAAITHLIASATDGLTSDYVTVTDNTGRLLTSKSGDNGIVAVADTYLSTKDEVERRKEQEITLALEKFLGPGKVSIVADVVLDMTSLSTTSTKYEKGMAQDETIDKTTNTKDALTDADGTVTSPGSSDTTSTIKTTSKLPETIEVTQTVPGQIKSWSITAMVDLSPPPVPEPATPEDPAAAGGTPAPAVAAAAAVPIMKIEDVEDIIKTAIGGEKMLTDPASLTVKDIPIYRAPVIAQAEGMSYEKLMWLVQMVRNSSLGIFAVCALIVFKIFTKASKKTGMEAINPATGELSPSGMGMLPAPADSSDGYRQHIAGQLKQNPEQVKQLFASWLAEDS